MGPKHDRSVELALKNAPPSSVELARKWSPSTTFPPPLLPRLKESDVSEIVRLRGVYVTNVSAYTCPFLLHIKNVTYHTMGIKSCTCLPRIIGLISP